MVLKRAENRAFCLFPGLARGLQRENSGIEAVENKRELRMKRIMTGLIVSVALSVVCSATAQQGTPGGVGQQDRDRDRLQTCSPTMDQDRTRAHECLPDQLKEGVKEMKQAQEQYQQQLRDKKKELTACTDQERQQLRDQLRDAIKEQAQDRAQLRERLQELRECVPTHEQVMEQARERARDRDGSK